MTYSEREREFTFTKNVVYNLKIVMIFMQFHVLLCILFGYNSTKSDFDF